MSSSYHKSEELYAKAQKVLPGGVNSPVRAFGSVGLNPLFINRAKGAIVWDEDGNEFIDYVSSWGPMILGHSDNRVVKAVTDTVQKGLSFGAPCKLEVELAELVISLTGIEMVRMVSSGTEAVMSAIRLARGYTGKNKIIKFEGCYHGHSDSMLVKAGSGALTSGVPSSHGVTKNTASETLTAQYNNLNSVEELIISNNNEVAAIIVEPVAANMGLIAPSENFLVGLRKLCDKYNLLLIFDEVITGFRIALGGAQEYYGVKADLVTYGKIIGGGLPVGAYGGSLEIMKKIAPIGPVYQAGTLSGNPVAMAAGLCQLKILNEGASELYSSLNKVTRRIATAIIKSAKDNNIAVQVNQVESLCCVYFNENPVKYYSDSISSNQDMYATYFKQMLSRGIYLAPSQFEAMFIGASHSVEIIDKTIIAIEQTFKAMN